MKISWKITTYGRVSTLNETLYSYLNQTTLEDTECIIVNDYPLQKLEFSHPRVKIFNLDRTFDTIGEKENFAVLQCSGDLIAVTDDDDVYMPLHNENIRKYWKEGTNLGHWKGAFYNEPEITNIGNLGNSGIVYSKEAWRQVGGHPIMNAGGDMDFVKSIRRQLKGVINMEPPDKEVSAVYRWKMVTDPIYHQSGRGYDKPDTPNIIERHSAFIEERRKKGEIPTGHIKLSPIWKKNYHQLIMDYIDEKSTGNIS